MKEIIFYTYMPENCKLKLYTGYWETQKAIELGEDIICTTQMTCLDSHLLELGYDIFVKEPSEPAFSITYRNGDVICDKVLKKLRLSHNLEKLWKAGAFRSS